MDAMLAFISSVLLSVISIILLITSMYFH
jgi:hypothetical protein